MGLRHGILTGSCLHFCFVDSFTKSHGWITKWKIKEALLLERKDDRQENQQISTPALNIIILEKERVSHAHYEYGKGKEKRMNKWREEAVERNPGIALTN